MANIRRMAPAPSPAQIRDYILTMIEGLSALAETADDLQTRDRMRDFADHLMMSWSPRFEALLRQEFGRLDELVAAHAAEHPDAPAAALGDRVLTYADLDLMTDRLAAALQRDGLGKGDAIALCAGASLEYIALILAASRVGVVVAPMATWLSHEAMVALVADSGARWLLLRNRAHVRRRKDRIRLREVLRANRALFIVYVLKDDLKQLWRYRYPGAARRFWRAWYRRACASRLEPLKRFARHMDARIEAIVSHCHYRLNNGFLEGMNNKIKVLKRIAYGYRDDDYFFLKIRAAFPGNPG